jgi:hypothetical protein
MSAVGTKQTYCGAHPMSAFGGEADIRFKGNRYIQSVAFGDRNVL